MNGQPLAELTIPGLHEHAARLLHLDQVRSGRAIDLAAGSGAWCQRLVRAGYDVTAVERDVGPYHLGDVPCVVADFDTDADHDRLRALGAFDLVTALEIIEHVENPIGFLRLIRDLLAPNGSALVTTPNVDSLPARLKFLLRGRLRMMDEWGEPTHISPIFWDLLNRQYLPAAGLRLAGSWVYPTDGVAAGRPAYRRVLTVVAPLLRRNPRLLGDVHVLQLRAA